MHYLTSIFFIVILLFSIGQASGQSYVKRSPVRIGVNTKDCKQKHKAMRKYGIAGLTRTKKGSKNTKSTSTREERKLDKGHHCVASIAALTLPCLSKADFASS